MIGATVGSDERTVVGVIDCKLVGVENGNNVGAATKVGVRG